MYVSIPENYKNKDKFLESIYNKEEYYLNKKLPDYLSSCKAITAQDSDYQRHQKLVGNYINPFTRYKNLLIMWGTGVGKTLGAIAIAESFQPYIHKIRKSLNQTPEIYIIAKNEAKKNFYKELFNPMIGYITQTELDKLNLLKDNSTTLGQQRYQEYYKELVSKIKSKGFYRFFGSTKFTTLVTGKNVKLNDKKIRQSTFNKIKNNNYGVIIVDEAHKIDNNDIYKALKLIKENSIDLKIVLLSATPMVNKAQEIVSMLNLLSDEPDVKISDLFDSKDLVTKKGLEIIAQRSLGHVSYMTGHNPFTFPKRINKGSITPPFKSTYLIKVEMSKYQWDAYKKFTSDEEFKHISNIGGSRGILDAVLPKDSFTRKQIEELLVNSSKEELDKLGINRQEQNGEYYITGKILRLDNFIKYSPKFCKIFVDITGTFNKNSGTVLVYNDQITGIGLKLFGEMLKENGIDEYNLTKSVEINQSEYSDNTLCIYCNVDFKHHTNTHKFIPAKFIYLYGEITENERTNILNIVNSEKNMNGEIVKCILGSEIISESIDFKRLRGIFITNFQDNISTTNQIIGRAIRHCSHADLPENQRNVEVFQYCIVLPRGHGMSIEEEKYLNNEVKHTDILKVEEVLKLNAMDCLLNQSKCVIPIPKVKLDTKSYDAYFSQNSIKYFKKQILKIFKQNIIQNYEEIKKNIIFSNHQEKYLIIALHKMIKNKDIIFNRFNDPGFIIYKSGLYKFQPEGNTNYNITELERLTPITNKSIHSVSILNYINSINEIKKFDLDTVLEKIEVSPNYSKLISDLSEINKVILLEYGIYNNVKKILHFFSDFLLTDSDLESAGYNTSDSNLDYIGHTYIGKPRCIINGTWSDCVKRYKDISKIPENDLVIGFMDKIKNKIVFKIREQEGKKNIDKRKVKKGFVCSSSSNKSDIVNIAKKLGIKNLEKNIQFLCNQIEEELRSRELKDKGKVKWFYEYIELL